MNDIIDNTPFFSKLFVAIDLIDGVISFNEMRNTMRKVNTFANR